MAVSNLHFSSAPAVFRNMVLGMATAALLLLSCCTAQAQKPGLKKGKGGKTLAFTACAKTIKQGISGMVYQQRGNMMPGPGRNTKGNPVHRTLYVFQLTNSDSLEKADSSGFWKKPPTKCLAVGFSDASGCFKAALPEGTYSLFVQEPGKGFYANRFDGNNNVFPVEVKKDSVTAVTFNISYGAAF